MANESLIKNLEELVAKNEELKNAYWWSPPQAAAMRRNYEHRHSIPEIKFTFKGDEYSFELVVDCSCRNVYVRRYYSKNGKKTTIRTVKKLIEMLKEN